MAYDEKSALSRRRSTFKLGATPTVYPKKPDALGRPRTVASANIRSKPDFSSVLNDRRTCADDKEPTRTEKWCPETESECRLSSWNDKVFLSIFSSVPINVPRARKPYGGRRRDRLTQRARNPLVRLAERHLSTNVDRVPRNRIPNIMGMTIDSARLAVVRHDFVEH